ncbi:hypothetical protein JMJ77_0010615 [Colletotrichum scovillei]|uniref:Uncharacterized protein n=1 Tax=Colletotrichum scovillei TaxID=1209932 RepID=A0A9P7UAH8_9PEZI|nr:hypothetical protein JMJ77_0010615 [Colletotrichum scovillei]KAG7059577.1 hypothetical protein JMJ78_0014868 [Colletotrichum scovillei]KAG7067026.1 hypothetical protein JMJ76_0008471 [Colletotrichum scovillei]
MDCVRGLDELWLMACAKSPTNACKLLHGRKYRGRVHDW